ncbi:MAG TPA: class I SAM-dependent methyltransferase, partial [Candidatus Angelobacter sp.]|nr:class I SAM-dependent methyltransferase [Candidatus Angelobacter sp.]
MKALQRLQRNWEGLAQTDPLWAICSDPEKRNGQWGREELFATGRNEIKVVLAHVAELGLNLDWNAPALDFGCGVGRLTQALAAYFPECWGVDISPTMIRLAKKYNQDLPQCRFLLNEHERLKSLQDNYFGFVYTSIVLQHIAKKYSRRYITELIRVLKPGGVLVFQLPDSLRLGLMKKLRVKLGLRLKMEAVFGSKKSYVMEMHCIPEAEVRELVHECGGQVVDVRITNSADPAFCGNL